MSKQHKHEALWQEFSGMLASVTSWYVLIFLAVFPLYTHNQYFDILRFRFAFFWKGTLAYTGVLTVLLLVYLLSEMRQYGGFHIKGAWAAWRQRPLHRKFRLTDWCMALILLSTLISLLLTPYKYEAFWGNEGRFQGLLCWLMYGAAYLGISRFYRYRRWHLYAFLAAGMAAVLWGITDFFAMDIFGFLKTVRPDQRHLFTSSVGNIDTYTNYTAMLLAVSAGLFLSESRRALRLLAWCCFFLSSLGHIMGMADNAVISTAAIFWLAPVYFWRERRDTARYLCLLAGFLTALSLCAYILKGGFTLVDGIEEGTLLSLSKMPAMPVLALAVWAVAAVLLWLWRKETCALPLQLRRLWLWLGWAALAVLVAVIALCTALPALRAAVPESLSHVLVFDEHWGTDRGYIWRLAWRAFSTKLSFLQRLFGAGADSYVIVMNDNFYQEMVSFANQIYDSAHNEYLNYLLTIGIFGLLGYLSLLFVLFKQTRRAVGSPAAVCTLAVAAYAMQALINIAIPITTPIFFTLMFMAAGLLHRQAAAAEKVVETETAIK